MKQKDKLMLAACLACVATLVFTAAILGKAKKQSCLQQIEDIEVVEQNEELTQEEAESVKLDNIFWALAWEESKLERWAYNKDEDAVSYTQQRKIFVDECNRILELTSPGAMMFTYEDRWDAELHRKMFDLFMLYHNPKLDIDTACDLINPHCSRGYHERVRAEFERLEKGGAE